MIHNIPKEPHQGNAELVQFLEGLLSRARSGHTTGVILMEVEKGESAACYTCIGISNRWEQAGLMQYMTQRIYR